MNLKEDVKPISYLKSHTTDMLHFINETHRPIIITQNGEVKGILQDPKSYQQTREAITLLKLVAQGEQDIKHNRLISQDDVFKKLKKSLAKHV